MGNSIGVKPADKPRDGLIVIQEVFGVNPHIRWVADGYHVIALARSGESSSTTHGLQSPFG